MILNFDHHHYYAEDDQGRADYFLRFDAFAEKDHEMCIRDS